MKKIIFVLFNAFTFCLNFHLYAQGTPSYQDICHLYEALGARVQIDDTSSDVIIERLPPDYADGYAINSGDDFAEYYVILLQDENHRTIGYYFSADTLVSRSSHAAANDTIVWRHFSFYNYNLEGKKDYSQFSLRTNVFYNDNPSLFGKPTSLTSEEENYADAETIRKALLYHLAMLKALLKMK